MSDQPRVFPERPSLRYLKLEAKRRLAAGEFTTLHDAQLVIAREHGYSSWAVLKQQIETQTAPVPGTPSGSHALDQVRWVIGRFVDSDQDGWTAPGQAELLEHFTDYFLSVIPAERLVTMLSSQNAVLRSELSVTAASTAQLQAELPGVQIQATTEPEPPHRLTGLALFPDGRRITDPRLAAATSRAEGDVPDAVPGIADASMSDLALPGLVLAGTVLAGTVLAGEGPGDPSAPEGAVWALARGWADLDAERPLHPEHRFPAYSITKLITAVTVLRLVADGAVRLDGRANDYLGPIRLAGDDVTVRELLAHTAGVDTPAELFAGQVPPLETLTGPEVGCSGPRGRFEYSNGGYAVLGQLIADVSGEAYPAAVTRLVLRPLGMDNSWFPARWPDDPDAVTGYGLENRAFQPTSEICTLPAAGGLWATAADLVRFAHGWRGLLPAELAAEALRPQAARPDGTGVSIGLGWVVNEAKAVTGHAGGGRGGSSSLIVAADGGRIHVALTNRLIPIEPVNARVLRAVS
jgi:CubicO group peptidase (beta-lactamase class C family)